MITVGLPNDFDSAVGEILSVVNAETLTPDVYMDPYDSEEMNGWGQQNVRVGGVNGKTPNFYLDFTNYRMDIQAPAAPWRMLHQYLSDSATLMPPTWSAFDNGSGDVPHVFSNNSPFTEDVIEIAVRHRWRYRDTQRATQYTANHPYGHQLPSADANNVFHTETLISPPHNSTQPTTLNLYGVLVDDLGSQSPGQDKLNILILQTQHPSEDQGNWYGWALVKHYLESVGELYDWFRRHCRLFVYDVNPTGRYYGSERYTMEETQRRDPNRLWHMQPSQRFQVPAVKRAVEIDMPYVSVMLDFHGGASLGNTRPFSYGLYASNTHSPLKFDYIDHFNAVSPYTLGDMGNSSNKTAAYYGAVELGAQVSLTLEFPVAGLAAFPDIEREAEIIMNYHIQTLRDMTDSGKLVFPPGAPVNMPARSPLQNLDSQSSPAAAMRLNGVLQ